MTLISKDDFDAWIASLKSGDRLSVSSGRKFYEGIVKKVNKTTVVVHYRQSDAMSFRKRDGFQTGDNTFPLFIKPLSEKDEEVIKITKLENRYRKLVEEIGIPGTLASLTLAIQRLESLQQELSGSL